MADRQHIPASHPNAREAVRVLVQGSALRWNVELQDNGSVAVIKTPPLLLSSGERLLWGFLGTLAGRTVETDMFTVANTVDEDSRAAIIDSLACLFGVPAQASAA